MWKYARQLKWAFPSLLQQANVLLGFSWKLRIRSDGESPHRWLKSMLDYSPQNSCYIIIMCESSKNRCRAWNPRNVPVCIMCTVSALTTYGHHWACVIEQAGLSTIHGMCTISRDDVRHTHTRGQEIPKKKQLHDLLALHDTLLRCCYRRSSCAELRLARNTCKEIW